MKTAKKSKLSPLLLVVTFVCIVLASLLFVGIFQPKESKLITSNNKNNVSDNEGQPLKIPENWQMLVKPFGQEVDNLGFNSRYFPLGCSSNCQGLRIINKENEVDLIFDIVQDDHGIRCSNEAKVTSLQNGWYRVRDRERIQYVRNNLLFNHSVSDVFQEIPQQDADNGWEISINKTYQTCIQGTGVILNVQIDKLNPGISDSITLLEFPTISNKVDLAVLSDIDQIITSIKE